MKLFRRSAPPSSVPARATFGEWLLERFTGAGGIEGLTFAELERAIGNGASVAMGAAYAAGMEDRLGKIAPGYLADLTVVDRDLYAIPGDELLDVNVCGTMVREHLATRLAWTSTRAGLVESRSVGIALEGIGAAYALLHRDQLTSVIEVWDRVAQGLVGGQHPGASPDLQVMGLTMLAAFQATVAPEAVAAS